MKQTLLFPAVVCSTLLGVCVAAAVHPNDASEIDTGRGVIGTMSVVKLTPDAAERPTAIRFGDARVELPEAFKVVGNQPTRKSDSGEQWKLAYASQGKTFDAYIQITRWKAKADFYTPYFTIAGNTRVAEYWEAVRNEAKTYASVAESLKQFESLNDRPGSAGKTPDDARRLAAKYHVRRTHIGLGDCFLYRAENATVLVRSIKGTGDKGVADCFLFDAAGEYRGDALVHLPVDELTRNNNDVLKTFTRGLRFPDGPKP